MTYVYYLGPYNPLRNKALKTLPMYKSTLEILHIKVNRKIPLIHEVYTTYVCISNLSINICDYSELGPVSLIYHP